MEILPPLDERLLQFADLEPFARRYMLNQLVDLLTDGREVARANSARALALSGVAHAGMVPMLRDTDLAATAAAESLVRLGTLVRPHLKQLIETLGNTIPEIYEVAISVLVKFLEEPDADLVKALDIPSEVAHRTLLEACTRDPDAGSRYLKKALAHSNLRIRLNAIEGLERIAKKGAVIAHDDLLKLQETDPTTEIRTAARAAVLAIIAPERDALVEYEPIGIPHFETRRLSTEHLTKHLADIKPERMVLALRDGREVVRINAATAISLLGGDFPNAAAAIAPLALLTRDSSAKARTAALTALGVLGPISVAAADAIVATLGDREARVHEAATEALGKLGDGILPALVRGLNTDNDQQAERIIPLVTPLPGAVDALVESFNGPELNAQINTARALGRISPDRIGAGREALLNARTGRHVRVTPEVRKALTRLDGPGKESVAPITVPDFDARLLSREELEAHKGAITVDRMVLALKDGRELVRANAATALSLFGKDAASAAQSVALLTRDSTPTVRRAAATALGHLGDESKTTIDALVAALGDRDARAADAALESLKPLEGKALAALIRGFDTTNDLCVDRAIALILRVDDPVSALVRAFNGPSTNVQVNTARALGRLGEARVGAGRKALEDARTGRHVRVTAEVRKALALLGEREEAGPTPIAIPDFDARYLSHEDIETHKDAIDLDRMLLALKDGRGYVRANAATALGVLGEDARATAPTLAVLTRDATPDVRRAAAAALGHLGDSAIEFSDSLVAALGDKVPQVVQAAFRSLEPLKDGALDALIRGLETRDDDHVDHIIELINRLPEAPYALEDAFESPSVNVQVNTARALGRLGAERVGDGRKALEDARTGRDISVTAEVRKALALLGEQKEEGVAPITVPDFDARLLSREELEAHRDAIAIDRMILALKDGRELVRANAATALSLFGKDAASAAQPIALLTRDSMATVRRAAATALGHLGDESKNTIDALVAALGDRDARAADAALKSLEPLEGKALAALIRGFDTTNDMCVDRTITLILRVKDPLDALVRAFENPSVNVQVNVARALGRLGAKRVGAGREALEDARTGRHIRVTAEVRKALALLGEQKEEGVAPITVPDFDAHIFSREELEAHRDAITIDRMTLALKDGRELVRANAATALSLFGKDAASAAQPIALLTRDSTPTVRRAAATALGHLGDESKNTIDALVAALGDRDARAADAALKSLEPLGGKALAALIRGFDTTNDLCVDRAIALILRVKDPVDALVRAFENPSVNVQVNVARALGRLGEARVGAGREALEDARTGRHIRVTAEVRKALALLGEQKEEGVAPIAIPDFDAHIFSREELEAHRDAITIDRMTLALKDGREHVRANAATALSLFGGDAASAAQPVALLTRDSTPTVRRAAATALGHLGDESKNTIDALVAALGDRDARAADAALKSLEPLGGKALAALIRGFDTTNDLCVDRAIALILRVKDPLDALVRAFENPSVNVQVNVARALGRLGPKRVGAGREVLEDARTGRHVRVTAEVRKALALFGEQKEEGVAPIAIPDFDERIFSREELEKHRDAITIDRMTLALKDGRELVRANAATALSLFGGDAASAAQPVALLTRDSMPKVRLAAATALGYLGDESKTVIDALVAALGDRAARAADAARIGDAALKSLEPLGDKALASLIRGFDTTNDLCVDRIITLILRVDDPVNALVEAFENPSVNVQVNTARALGRLGKARIGAGQDALLNARTGRHVRVTAEVRKALSLLGERKEEGIAPITVPGFDEQIFSREELEAHRDAITIDRMVLALKDGRELVRANAATALSLFGEDAASAAQSVALLTRDSTPTVRRAAATALGHLGDDTKTVIDALVAALGDRDARAADAALKSLEPLGDKALASLIRGLDTTDNECVDRIIRLILRVDDPVSELVEAFNGPSTNVQVNAARALGRLGEARIGAGQDALLNARTGRHVRVTAEVRKALVLLGEQKEEGVAPITIPDFDEQIFSREELEAHRDAITIDRMVLALKDGREFVRANAATALGLFGKDAASAAQPIALLTRDSMATVRRAAATALGQLGDESKTTIDALVAALGDMDPRVADAALKSLEPLGGKALASLIRGFDTTNDRYVDHAITLILRVDDPVDALVRAFESPSVNVQVNTARALGRLGSKRVGAGREALEDARTERHVRVTTEVRAALELLDGRG